MLKTFFKYYKPYKLAVAGIVFGSLAAAAMELLFPAVVRQILNVELPQNNVAQVMRLAALLCGLYLGNLLLQYVFSYWGYLMSARMENDMRRDLFSHIQNMSFRFFDSAKTGQLLSRITGDLGEIGELAFRAPADVIVCLLSMLGTMAILMWMNLYLGVLVTVLLLGKTIHTIYLNGRMKAAYFANRVKQGEMTARAEESLSGIRLVKAFAAEEESLSGFMQKADAYVAVRKASFKVRAYFISSMGFFTNFINVAILVGGTLLISRGEMLFSDLVAFFLYVGIFIKPLMRLLAFTELYQRGMAGFQRFYEIMRQPEEITDRPNAIECKNIRGRIVFENLTFGYGEGREVIKNLNLIIEPGETVAFVGATGAGKTTLANLLLRFYEPRQGRVLLDDVDIADYTQKSLRRQIGLVQQDVFLFSDSVKYNIAYADPDASDVQIEAAAKAAAADEFIEGLPNKYMTEIGERGVKLSGGQKQRIAIARVFLKNPPIVVLDEATSALDNKTEKQIQRELDKLAAGRTTLIIAHRLSTVSRADKIVVLKNGSMVECGTQAELLAKQGAYYDLYHQ